MGRRFPRSSGKGVVAPPHRPRRHKRCLASSFALPGAFPVEVGGLPLVASAAEEGHLPVGGHRGLVVPQDLREPGVVHGPSLWGLGCCQPRGRQIQWPTCLAPRRGLESLDAGSPAAAVTDMFWDTTRSARRPPTWGSLSGADRPAPVAECPGQRCVVATMGRAALQMLQGSSLAPACPRRVPTRGGSS